MASLVIGGNPAAHAACLEDAVATSTVEIKRITDGDTVVLSDDRRVRIIGVNTAELNARHPWSRSLARQGSNAVERWLENSDRVFLVEGKEPLDRHGRVLGHLTNEKDELLAEFLIEQGVAAATAVKPNTRCANHLARIEHTVRDTGIGVWNSANPWFIEDEPVARNTHSGFRIVQATISKVNKTERARVLILSNGVTLSVRNALYKSLSDRLIADAAIEVRGWISFRGKHPKITLHHDSNIRFQ